MRVEMPLRVRRSIAWSLVKAHRIWKGNAEDAIIDGNNLLQRSRQLRDFGAVQLRHASEMSSATEQHFERPHRPEGHNRHETIVAADYTRLFALFDSYVITK